MLFFVIQTYFSDLEFATGVNKTLIIASNLNRDRTVILNGKLLKLYFSVSGSCMIL